MKNEKNLKKMKNEESWKTENEKKIKIGKKWKSEKKYFFN